MRNSTLNYLIDLVYSRNDFGYDGSTINIVVVIVVIFLYPR